MIMIMLVLMLTGSGQVWRQLDQEKTGQKDSMTF